MEGVRLTGCLPPGARQLPYAYRDERQDEGRKKDVGKRSISGRDQSNEAEPAREEHAADDDEQRDRKALHVAQVRACPRLPRMTDPFVDRMNGAYPALQQRREDHSLEQKVKDGQADPLQEEVGRKDCALHLRIES